LIRKGLDRWVEQLWEKLVAGENICFAALSLLLRFQIQTPSMYYLYNTVKVSNPFSIEHQPNRSTVIAYQMHMHYTDRWYQQVKANWPMFTRQLIQASNQDAAINNGHPLFSEEISSPAYADAFIPYRDAHTQEQVKLNLYIQPDTQQIVADLQYQLNESTFQIEAQYYAIEDTVSGRLVFKELEPMWMGLTAYIQEIVNLLSPTHSESFRWGSLFGFSFIQRLGQKQLKQDHPIFVIDFGFDFNHDTGQVGPYDLDSLSKLFLSLSQT